MIVIEIINLSGERGYIRCNQIVSIDGKSYPLEPPVPAVKELSDRLTIVEALIATVLSGEESLPPQPLPASCSAE